jgi:hypothetical protein
MKLSLFIFASLSLISSACGGTSETDVVPSPNGTITMKVNGVSWSGAASARFIENENMVINGINATAANQETIGLVIGKVTQVGTYKVKSRTGNAMLYSQKAVIHSGWEDGEVTVTSITTTGGKQVPSGTFFGTCINNSGGKVSITEGKF